MKQYPKIGIRPIIDGRQAVRSGLEEKTRNMAEAAKKLIESNVFYADGTPAQVVISECSIGGGEEAARCDAQFTAENVCATLSVTPCWCYGSETMDLNPLTIKAVWGFNGTERPGAVYLAAVLSAYNQRSLPAFSIYGKDVQDVDDHSIPADVEEKILRFARCAVSVGQMRGKAYVGIGGVSMGIMGSFLDPQVMQDYFGIRAEWVDMSEVGRRLKNEIYDKVEFERAYAWTKKNCPEGFDKNPGNLKHTAEQKAEELATVVKMTMIIRDIMLGNEELAKAGYTEESLGRNAILGGFQGQRMWSDWMPNADFCEAILNTSFDWDGRRQPVILATENDSSNGMSMLFANLITGAASLFADVRTYWSPDAVKRVTGWTPEGLAKDGFIHMINSGAAALDATGASKDGAGKGTMKKWWEMTPQDIDACLSATDWCPAALDYFPGGGFSSHFKTLAEMPLTMIRLNLIGGMGASVQIVEGYSCVLPDAVHSTLEQRTDPTWPTTWFVPRLDTTGPCKTVYDVMAKWGSNHAAFAYGHVGADAATLASMLRIPVSLHNLPADSLFRPHAWGAFGTADPEGADFRACGTYGPLYK
ncbi:L-fucose isomerase [Breznakiella homolactica]|uniref:L-fucose isomerase n=1 Tax=Breznakiella homolactica TaxID=2798577 RepID=A0A7T7XK57_9SPIR|nr:L-fucose isomerase [Breznakiella homolactica]QQO07905.1 L-fucose isomerase [Breznakiella homolactica]